MKFKIIRKETILEDDFKTIKDLIATFDVEKHNNPDWDLELVRVEE